MIRKFLSKYILEVIPSIVATVVGAYIVTHYINSKPDADKPKAAVAAPVNPVKDEPAIAKKQAIDKPVADKTEKNDKIDKPETASAPAEPRRHQPTSREKATAKNTTTPVVAPPAEAAAKESISKPDDPRDANEIARAAIDRLRSAEPRRAEPMRAMEPVIQETIRQEPPRQERAKSNAVVYAPPAPQQPPLQQAPIQSLPQAVTVAPAQNETTLGVAPTPFPVPVSSPPVSHSPVARADDPSRPTPPAEIPSRPMELRAKERTSVAEEVVSTAKDVVSSAKSVFQAVIPGTN